VKVAGAILINNASPLIEDCVFENNTSQYGGAIYARISSATIHNCSFVNNSALYDGGAVQGLNSGLTLSSCDFIENHAGNRGGAAHQSSLNALPSETVVGCLFQGNDAVQGGALSYYITSGAHKISILESEFSANESPDGGAIWTNLVNGVVSIGSTTICGNAPPQIVSGSWIDLGENAIFCDSDFDCSGGVGAEDLAVLLGCWGIGGCDLNGDGVVGSADLAILLGDWGPC